MSNLTSKDAAIAAVEALENKKAEEITIIDISTVSPIADYFIICNGNNRNQVQALSDHVEETLGRMGFDRRPIEGYDNANWILLDYHDVIIHIFDKENRSFYDLERIWRDGKQISKEDLKG
ncbi:MAG: ribosome silencing factor [Lachnospiraceae bacterium]|nr:ribosome silencing factor [Lachnospiraceae bacterium]